MPPELNFNVDFSQYNPTTSDETKTTAEASGSTNKGHALKGGPTPGQQLAAYFIQWNALVSFSGFADVSLLVVGDDNMNPEDIDVHVVPGLFVDSCRWQGDSRVLSTCNILQFVHPTILSLVFPGKYIPFIR